MSGLRVKLNVLLLNKSKFFGPKKVRKNRERERERERERLRESKKDKVREIQKEIFERKKKE